MNKQRRSEIEMSIFLMEDAKSILEYAMFREEECRDNIPENMQRGKKYERAGTAYYNLDVAMCSLNSAINSLNLALE
jgi:hypothetical protein